MSKIGVPHFINATNPEGRIITWNTPPEFSEDSTSWTFSDWHEPSGQPNDCIVDEPCVFIGPNGKVCVFIFMSKICLVKKIFQWFDLTCGPKIVPDFEPSEKWPRLDPVGGWSSIQV